MGDRSDDETLFENAFRRRGGLWAIEDIDPAGKGLASQFLLLCRALAPDSYVGFINSHSFNAVASVASGRDLIGLHIGSFEIIHNAFFNLLSARDTLPGIGDCAVELDDPGPANLRQPVDAKPNDPVRTEAAMDLAFCACLILFCHENAHIELCHIPFLTEQFGVTEYCEMQPSSLSNRNVWLYRALENDADITGALGSTRIWKYWYEHMASAHLDSMGWERAWITAAHMLFWIVELLHPPRHEGVALNHPAPYFRMASVMDVVSEYGEIPGQLSESELQHDTLGPWLARQTKALDRPLMLVTDEAIGKQKYTLSRQYRQIAGRLEELQDARGERTGRPVERPNYPGRGWASRSE